MSTQRAYRMEEIPVPWLGRMLGSISRESEVLCAMDCNGLFRQPDSTPHIG